MRNCRLAGPWGAGVFLRASGVGGYRDPGELRETTEKFRRLPRLHPQIRGCERGGVSSAGKQMVRRVGRGMTLRTDVSRRGADTVVEGHKAGAKTGTEP